MTKFTIPITVTYELLGEEFKDSQLTFRSVPTSEYEWLDKQQAKIKKATDKEAVRLLNETISDYFIRGKFYDIDSEKTIEVSKDDLALFPVSVLKPALEAMIGGADPKDLPPSKPPSMTE